MLEGVTCDLEIDLRDRDLQFLDERLRVEDNDAVAIQRSVESENAEVGGIL